MNQTEGENENPANLNFVYKLKANIPCGGNGRAMSHRKDKKRGIFLVWKKEKEMAPPSLIV